MDASTGGRASPQVGIMKHEGLYLEMSGTVIHAPQSGVSTRLERSRIQSRQLTSTARMSVDIFAPTGNLRSDHVPGISGGLQVRVARLGSCLNRCGHMTLHHVDRCERHLLNEWIIRDSQCTTCGTHNSSADQYRMTCRLGPSLVSGRLDRLVAHSNSRVQ